MSDVHWSATPSGVVTVLREEIEIRNARIEELEAKLSKAVEALKYYAQDDDDGGWLAKSTLAELKGGKDE